MASSPLTSWQIDGETMETVRYLFWGGSKVQMVTAAMKLRHLLLGRRTLTNLDSILKSSNITLPTEVCLVEVMVFPVVMYGCESWTIKKAEDWRIDAFELCSIFITLEPLIIHIFCEDVFRNISTKSMKVWTFMSSYYRIRSVLGSVH